MNKIYDYIIVGTGPSGLSLAWYLSQENKTVLLIDRESSIGGCHRVTRVDGLITEHGPRVYSDVYLTFMHLLHEMNLDFNDLFTQYLFDLSNIGNKTKLSFSISEYFSFIKSFIGLLFNSNYGKDISMKDFMINNSFSAESTDYIDRLCRLTDGAETKRYTLFQFLQLVNNQALYKLYQPKLPTDRGLLYLIEKKLKETKLVTIQLNQDVISINSHENSIYSITIKDKLSLNNTYKLRANNFILAIPPKPLNKLLSSSGGIVGNMFNNVDNSKNAFGNIEFINNWSEDNSYFEYIPVTLHWKEKLELEKIWGFPASDWGLAFIILSNYMKFNDPGEYQTVISTSITFTDRKSSVTNKTADESTLEEVYQEILRQLRQSYPNISNPDKMIKSPQVYYDDNIKKWINTDTAFVTTINPKQHLPFKSKLYSNLYNCGAQNGKSKYYFTSLETAIANALALFNELEPGAKHKRYIKNYLQITDYIHNIILIIILIILFYIYYQKNI